MKNQFKKITKWQNKTFKNSNAISKAMHLKEEVNELINDLNTNSVRLEIADCFILLFGIAEKLKMNYDDIVLAIEEKHLINTNRKWGNPDKNGVVNHIK